MNGIVIKQMVPETFDGSGGGSPIFSVKTYGEGVSNFYVFFHPLFEYLDEYKWCRIIGDNFDLPSYWYDDEDEEKDDPRLSEIGDSNLMRLPPKVSDGNGCDLEDYTDFAAVLELSYVQKFSKYFRDDHDLIFLVNKAVAEERCWKILQYLCFRNADQEIESILETSVDAVFYNFDGLYWAFFAKDNNLIDKTRKHLLETGNIEFDLVSAKGVVQIANLGNKPVTW